MSSLDLVPQKSAAQIANEKNLVPFKPGHDPRRKPGRGRPSPLDDPEFVEVYAQAVAEGMSGPELAKIFNMGERTMRDYKRDPRVKAAAIKFIEDRVIRVTRKVDSQIEQRLEHPDKLDTETLLKIRKEFLGGVMRQQTQGSKDDLQTIHEAIEAIESNPDFAAEFEALVTKKVLDKHAEGE